MLKKKLLRDRTQGDSIRNGIQLSAVVVPRSERALKAIQAKWGQMRTHVFAG